jgi:hypothetical protein
MQRRKPKVKVYIKGKFPTIYYITFLQNSERQENVYLRGTLSLVGDARDAV